MPRPEFRYNVICPTLVLALLREPRLVVTNCLSLFNPFEALSQMRFALGGVLHLLWLLLGPILRLRRILRHKLRLLEAFSHKLLLEPVVLLL